MVNSLQPRPSTRPSRVYSIAGETMALAKPLMGTNAPAPAYWPILSNTPAPVSTAVSSTIITLAKVEAAEVVRSSQERPTSMKTCPRAQMPPPTMKARKSP